jgi:phage-related protein
MANIVAITVKATDSTADGFAKIRAEAAKAGAEAADAFNEAFRLKAAASATTRDKLEESGGISGDDKSLVNKLKSYANTPGGIGIIGTGNDTSLMSMLKNSIRQQAESGNFGLIGGGGESSTDLVREVLANNVTGNTTTKDFVNQVLEGNSPGNVSTEDLVKQVLENNVTGNVSTKDFVDQVIEGNKPGNIDTTDTIHEKVDTSKVDGKKDGTKYGSDFLSAFDSAMKGSGGGDGGDGIAGALGGALNSGGAIGGALPGTAGVSGLAATVTGLAGALIAVLPALTATASGLGVIGGGFAILIETSAKFKAAMTSDLTDLEGVAAKAAAPLAKPLEDAATQIVGFFKDIEPDLQAVFADSGQLVEPLVKGFEELMSGAGPGFLAMIKSAGPVFAQFAGSLSDLGHDLGEMFSDFAQDSGGSGVILRSFMDLIGSLLPFLGKLGQIMVSSLAPAFAAFSSAIQAVFPALTPLLSIIGSFAGAVLTDLASVLGAVGALLVGLAPSFKTLAGVASSLFNTMENAGVFAIFGNVLESLALPLANLINALVKGLAPAIPGIITLVGQLTTFLADLITAGLVVMINAVTTVIKVLSPILPLILDVIAVVKAWTIVQGVLDAVLAANPIGIVILAVAALIGIVVELVQHWGTVEAFFRDLWHDVEQIFDDASSDINGALDGAWDTAYGNVTRIWDDIVSFFKGVPGDILREIDSLGGDIESWAAGVMEGMLSGFESVWHDITSFFGGLAKDILDALGIHSPPDWAISAGVDIMNGIGIGMGQARGAYENELDKLNATAQKASQGQLLNPTGSGSSIQQLMKSMAASLGWTGTQWTALNAVEMREAGYNLSATNPTSGAYGLAQFIDGPSEYAQYGGNATTAAGQITAMLNYIAQRYGSPAAAWDHEASYGWYDHGGWLPTGLSLAYNGTGAPEPVGAMAGGSMQITLAVDSAGSTAFEAFMVSALRNWVRVKGGGSVQKAFGIGTG